MSSASDQSVVRYRVRFSGEVQGVGFRVTAISQGRGLAVHGTVRNEGDGSVMLDIEGARRDCQELIARIEAHAPGIISDKTVDECESLGRTSGFRIG